MVVMVGGGEVWTVGAEEEEEKEESGMRIFKTRTHHRGVVGNTIFC